MGKPPLLYLVHRIPYPPNKGDKVRSFHILKELAAHFEVHLGTFVDLEEDWAHVPTLDTWCASVHALGLAPSRARLASLSGLLTGEALSVPYYRNADMARWVRETVAREGIGRAVVFSGAMAQYLADVPVERTFIDFCDVDSAKWTQYADSRRWPMSWLYRREGRRLAQFEQRMAARADHVSFVTQAECDIFLRDAPAFGDKVIAVENGVDTAFFAPEHGGESPYDGTGPHLAFTGAMDYWPNVDAACWFAESVFPRVKARFPGASFHVVGMNPAPAVNALTTIDRVHVTGRVPDVRPYIHHADVVVAPLRVARGIQNKVLEAMAMARPVVMSQACATGLRGEPGVSFGVAETTEDYVDAIEASLSDDGIGPRARRVVEQAYAWPAHLAAISNRLLTGCAS
ncbi:MAG: sugar transferase [Porticoccaceae bacterium]|nr:sugar transferase [Porticoccaceae bacterium]